MAYKDFTTTDATRTIVDNGSNYTVSQYDIAVAAETRTVINYASFDYGADNISASAWQIKCKVRVSANSGYPETCYFPGISTVQGSYGTEFAANPAISFRTQCYIASGSTWGLYVSASKNGAALHTTGAGNHPVTGLTVGATDYWLKYWLDPTVGTYGTLYCGVYSDAYTTLIGTADSALTSASSTTRYLNALHSENISGTATISYTVSDVELHTGYSYGTAALVAGPAVLSGTGTHVNVHAGTAALVAGAATLSATGNDVGLYSGTASLVSDAARISATGLVSFPGAHASDGTVILVSGHAAMNSTGAVTSPGIGSGTLTSSPATLSATGEIVRLPSPYKAVFETLTGTPKLKILRMRDNYNFDWADLTFKSGTPTTLGSTMTQVNATNWPTTYYLDVTTTDWNDGDYMFWAYDDGDSTNYSFDQFTYKNGQLFYGGLLTDERAAVFTGAAQSGVMSDEEHNQLMALQDLVWAVVLEGTHTAADFQRIFLAIHAGAGDVPSNSGGSMSVKSPVDGTTVRLTGTYTPDSRTVTTLDGT